jgi:predicted phosphodiesterase
MKRTHSINVCRLAFLLAIIMFTSCEDMFHTHPYDMNFSGEGNINARNIEQIKLLCEDKDTLRFAVISDTHAWYTETEAAVNDINKRDSIDFVIHSGDLTDSGTTFEYKQARKFLGRLNKPYIALIGNHDFLGTGAQGYDWMYGKRNFSFIIGGVKFVCIDTNAIEYNHMAAVPDFNFMETEAKTDTELFDRTIVVMHAAPYSDQFNNNVSKAFNYYLHMFPGLMFCIYGHEHQDVIADIFNDGLLFYGINSVSRRSYNIFTITPEGYEQEKIDY